MPRPVAEWGEPPQGAQRAASGDRRHLTPLDPLAPVRRRLLQRAQGDETIQKIVEGNVLQALTANES